MSHRNHIPLVAAGLLVAALTVACASAPETTSSAAPAPTSVVERQAAAGALGGVVPCRVHERSDENDAEGEGGHGECLPVSFRA